MTVVVGSGWICFSPWERGREWLELVVMMTRVPRFEGGMVVEVGLGRVEGGGGAGERKEGLD